MSSSSSESEDDGCRSKELILLGADENIPKYTFKDRRPVSRRLNRPSVRKRCRQAVSCVTLNDVNDTQTLISFPANCSTENEGSLNGL